MNDPFELNPIPSLYPQKLEPETFDIPITEQPLDPMREELGLQTSPMYQREHGLSPEDGDTISQLMKSIAMAEDPIAEITKITHAEFLGKSLGVDPVTAYANVDELSRIWSGKVMPPVTFVQHLKDNWSNGVTSWEWNEVGNQLALNGYSEELMKQADEIEKRLIPVDTPKFFLAQWLDVAVNSAPAMIESLMAGWAMGAATGATAGAMLGALPPLSLPTAGLSVPALAAAMGSVGMVVQANKSMMDNYRGGAYLRMLKAGVPHEIANTVSLVEGTLNGALEAAGELLVGLPFVPFKSLGSRIANKILLTGYGTAWAAKTMTRIVASGTGEGIENSLQYFVSTATDQLVMELAKDPKIKIDPITLDKFVAEFANQFYQGFGAGIIFGVPGLPKGIRADTAQMNAIKNLAVVMPTKEEFVAAVSQLKLEGSTVTATGWKTYLGKVYDTQQAKVQQEIQKRNAKEKPKAGEPAAPGAPSPVMGPLTREKGALATEVKITGKSKEGQNATLVVGDAAKQERYGYMNFETVGDTVFIKDVVSESAAQDVTREMILELGEKNPGKTIEWNPVDEAGVELKEDLIAKNPLGAQVGLNWTPTEQAVTEEAPRTAITRDYFSQQMTKLFNLAPEESDAMVGLAEALSANAGMPIEQWLNQYIGPEVGVRTKAGQASLSAAEAVAGTAFTMEKPGYTLPTLVNPLEVDRAEFKGRVKAVFTALQGADFHHATHEFFHMVERLALSPDQVKGFERAIGKLRETWTVPDVERLADLFEEYLSTGQAPTKELTTLFQKIAEIFNQIVSFLTQQGHEALSPEFKAAYDALFAKPESGVAQNIRKPTFARVSRAEVTMPLEQAVIQPKTEEPVKVSAIDPKAVPVEEVALSRITLSKDVPQFKKEANAKGVIEELKGKKYLRLGTAPIVLWERTGGELEVITGRHRFDLAQRLGEESIPSQIVRESEGFTAAKALTFDAESNIRDGMGSIEDYVIYFRATEIDEGTAEARGLLGTDKGRKGFAIGRYATDGLLALYFGGEINETKAAGIAAASRGDPRLTAVGIKNKAASAEQIVQQIEILKTFTPSSDVQTDMFGNEVYEESDKLAAEQVKKLHELKAEQSALSSMNKLSKGEAEKTAGKYGFKAGDTRAVKARMAVLAEEIPGWSGKEWISDPAKIAELKARSGVVATALFHPAFELKPLTEEELAQQRAKETAQAKGKATAATQQTFGFAKKTDAQMKDEKAQLALFHLDRNAPVENDPGKLPRAAFLSMREFNKVRLSVYIDSNGQVIANSRLTPDPGLRLTLGQWMVDDGTRGTHGHEIAQLRELNPYSLKLIEEDYTEGRFPNGEPDPTVDHVENWEGRGDDAVRYAEWMRQGMTPPPITVMETDKGTLQVSDGHRRVASAKMAGQKVLAWVWPAADHPEGLKINAGTGPVMRVGLTYEMATGKEYVTIQDEKTQLALFHAAPEEVKAFNERAVKEFGVTTDPEYAAWILTTGEMLDFRTKGLDYFGKISEVRMPHGKIWKVLGKGQFEEMSTAYMEAWKRGAVRMDFNKSRTVIQSVMNPTPSQLATIGEWIGQTREIGLEKMSVDANAHDYDSYKDIMSPTIDNVADFYTAADLYTKVEDTHLFHIDEERARGLPYKTVMPSDAVFKEAVQNTPGASITPDGLLIELTRFQKPEMEGEQAIRTGVFYLPSGSPQEKHYRGNTKTGYGGIQKYEGTVLVKAPLFAKGGTGGAAPKAAYDSIKGKGAYEAMRSDVLKNTVMVWDRTSEQSVGGTHRMLEQYGADPNLATEIVQNSKTGNTLPYAIQENIVAHAIREAGYDSVVGWSKKKDGAPFISEVFDVRELTYPSAVIAPVIHDMFTRGDREALFHPDMENADAGASYASLIRKAANYDTAEEFQKDMEETFGEADPAAADRYQRLWDAAHPPETPPVEAPKTGIPMPEEVVKEYDYGEKLDLAQTISDPALAQKVEQGNITDAEIDKATGKGVSGDEALKEKLKTAQAKIDEALATFTPEEQYILTLADELSTITAFEGKAKRMSNKIASLRGRLKTALKKNVRLSLLLADTAEGFKFDADIQKAITDERIKLVQLTETDKRLQQKARMYAERRAAMAKFRDQVRGAMAERRALMQLKETRKKLIRQIMAPPSRMVEFLGYADRIQEIQEQLDPDNHRVKTLEERKASKAFFDANPDAAALVPKATLELIYSVPVQQLTLAQLEELNELVQGLRKMGKMKRSLILVQDKRAKDSSKKTLVNTILRGKALQPVIGAAKKTGVALKAYMMGLKPGRIAQLLDGYMAGQPQKGEFWRILQEGPNEAWNSMHRMMDKRHDSVISQLDRLKITLDPLALKRLKGYTYLGGDVDIDGFRFSNGKMPTTQKVMYWYLGMQNDRSRAALLAGNKYPLEVVEKAIAQLPKNVKELADLISKDWDDNFPRYREEYINDFNEDLPKEDHYVTMNRLEISYKTREEKVAAELTGRWGLTKHYVDRGSTHARIDISDEHQKPIADDLMSVWMESVRDQEGFIYQNKMIRDMHSVLESDEVRQAVQQKFGPDMNKWIKKYVNDLAQDEAYSAAQGIEKWSRIARSNAAVAWLGFNVLSNAKQLIGWVNALADVGPLRLASAAAQFAAGQGKSIAKGKLLGNTLIEFVEERSEFVKHRQISQELEDMKRLDMAGYQLLVKKLGALSMKSLEVIDKVSVVIGWKAAYDKATAKNVSEAEAIKYADEVTVRTQPSMRVQDMAEMYRGGEVQKWFTMFTSDLNATYNRIAFDVPAALRNGMILQAFSDMLTFALAGAWIAVASGALHGDDEEKKKRALMLGAFSQYFDAIPFVGSNVMAALSGKTFQSGGVKIFPAIEYIQQIPHDVQDEEWGKAVAHLAESAALAFGVPMAGPKRAVKAFTMGDWEALLGWQNKKE